MCIRDRYKSGTHKLFIKITTHGFEDQHGVIKIIPLDFEERYYETFWFWFLISGVFTLLLLVAYQIGLKLNKRREDTLKEKIEEKTLELQDSINELAISKDAILNSLKEKNILLKEVHHRVKNNLQLIISMLNIQARRNNYDNIEDFIKKGETRISSMALIHQSLYQSEESLDKINFQGYVEELVDSIAQTFDHSNDKINYVIDANGIVFNLTTAIPLGLIINELVTNSLKYAFPNGQSGTIRILIQKSTSNLFELIIEDDGIGFDENKLQKKSFGLELIKLLTHQLNGTVTFESRIKTIYKISFEEISA
jgi:two-component sensor histidine kinase